MNPRLMPHFIGFDLDHECWIVQGFWRLERYLKLVAKFQELYPERSVGA